MNNKLSLKTKETLVPHNGDEPEDVTLNEISQLQKARYGMT